MLIIVLLTNDDIILQFNHFSQRLILFIKLYSHSSLPHMFLFEKWQYFAAAPWSPSMLHSYTDT